MVKEFIRPGQHFWLFDEYGNPIPVAKENELPLDYQVKGKLYIKIKDFDFEQDNLYSCICYSFQIYMYGTDKIATAQFDPSTNSTSLLADYDETTNNFAYTDLVDCLTNAVNLIKRFKPELIDWFENIEYLHETYASSPVDNNDLE